VYITFDVYPTCKNIHLLGVHESNERSSYLNTCKTAENFFIRNENL
jgi:hypothetical protein